MDLFVSSVHPQGTPPRSPLCTVTPTQQVKHSTEQTLNEHQPLRVFREESSQNAQ